MLIKKKIQQPITNFISVLMPLEQFIFIGFLICEETGIFLYICM